MMSCRNSSRVTALAYPGHPPVDEHDLPGLSSGDLRSVKTGANYPTAGTDEFCSSGSYGIIYVTRGIPLKNQKVKQSWI